MKEFEIPALPDAGLQNDDSARNLVEHSDSAQNPNPSSQSSGIIDEPQVTNDESVVGESLVDVSTAEALTVDNSSVDEEGFSDHITNANHRRDHIYDDSFTENDLNTEH